MIGIDKLRIAAAVAAAALCGEVGLLRAAEEPSPEASRLEVNRNGWGSSASREAKDSKRAAAKVQPFAEDEEPAQVRARPQAERASKFQPRFKAPGVRQVQHADGGSSENTVKLDEQPSPADSASTASAGRPIVDEAFAKSKLAKADTEFSEVIELCRKGMATGLKGNYEDYARRLSGWAYNRRGEIRAAAHQDQEALADFEMAVELNANSWRAIHNRAVSYAYVGRVKDAMADFDHTIKLNKNYANAYFNRGELRAADGDAAGAVRDYTTAIEVGPADAAMFNSRANALRQLKKYGEALRDLSQAIEINPEDSITRVHRGDTYTEMGKYSEASHDYREAAKIDPKSGRAYRSAAWLMATCPDEHYRNEKVAVEVARKAIALDGEDDYRYLETLAAAQANAGQFKEAKETQEKAIAKAPRPELVPAEKRMALYQREVAYRDPPRQSFAVVGGEDEASQVRQASATSKNPFRPKRPKPLNRNQPADQQ